MVGAEVLPAVFLMQDCGLSAAAAALDTDAFCHVRSADLCGLNPTARAQASPIYANRCIDGHKTLHLVHE